MLAAAPWLTSFARENHFRFAPDPAVARLAHPVAADASPTSKDGIRYLQVDDLMILTGPEPVWHRQVEYHVDHERGLASAGQVNLYFQPAFQRVEVHAVDVWRNGVREDRRFFSSIETLRRESELESGLIDGGLTLSITIPDVRLGDRIAYRYSVIGYNPVFDGHFHDVYTARYSTPLARRAVRFVYPGSMSLRWKTSAAGFQTRHLRSGDIQELSVMGTSLKAIKEESLTPSTFDPYGRIEVSTFTDWLDVARWAMPLYVARLEQADLPEPLADALRLDPADPLGSALRATAFVQGEIRYTGLDMGVNSHAPNRPELVLKRRFGDCKDKSILLIALLGRAGIEAHPVLVNTEQREAVRDRLPSPIAFNHVMVRARIGERELWIDPTLDREFGTFSDRQPLPYRVGLPISAEDEGLVEIPYPDPVEPLVDVRQTIDFKADAGAMSAGISVQTDYRQAFAADVRTRFASRGAEEVGEGYLTYMQGFYSGIGAVNPPLIKEASGGVSTFEDYAISWNDESDGSVFGIVLFQILDWLPSINESKRVTPLQLSGPRFGRHVIYSSLKDGWAISSEKKVVENRYFRFERTVAVEDGLLVIGGRWQRKAETVMPSDVGLVRKDLEEVRDLAQFDIDLAPVSPMRAASVRDWSWPVGGTVVAMLILFALWLARQRLAFAGMLYAPRRTMARLIDGGGVHPGGLALAAACIVMSVVLEFGARVSAESGVMAVGVATGGFIGTCVRWVAWSGLLKLSFRMLGRRVQTGDVLRVTGWASAPMLVMLLAALGVLGLDVPLLDNAQVAPAEAPRLVVSALLMLAGVAWTLVAMTGAYAALVDSRRRQALAAIAVSLAIGIAIVLPLAFLVAVIR